LNDSKSAQAPLWTSNARATKSMGATTKSVTAMPLGIPPPMGPFSYLTHAEWLWRLGVAGRASLLAGAGCWGLVAGGGWVGGVCFAWTRNTLPLSNMHLFTWLLVGTRRCEVQEVHLICRRIGKCRVARSASRSVRALVEEIPNQASGPNETEYLRVPWLYTTREVH
jgi:hypothetical protein